MIAAETMELPQRLDPDWEFAAPAWYDFSKPDDELPGWTDDGYFGGYTIEDCIAYQLQRIVQQFAACGSD